MNLCNHIAIIPILIGLVLCVGVDTALATPSTQDVAVPLSSKNAFINKKPRVNYAPMAGQDASTSATYSGTARPMYSVSAGQMKSVGANTMQASVATATGSKTVSVSQPAAAPSVTTIAPVSFYSQRPVKTTTTFDSEELRTIRRGYGEEEEEEEEGGALKEGDTKYENGKWWRYDGEGWVEISKPEEPPVPVGDIPVLLLIVMLLVYGYMKKRGIKVS